MKCEECLPLLDLYSDGELPGRDSDSVAAHLAGCGACAARLQSLRDEQALYLRYECDAREAPEFWDEVLSQIAAEESRAPLAASHWRRGRLAPLLAALSAPRFSPTLVAALLVAAVGLTAAFMRYWAPRDPAPAHTAEVRQEGGTASARKDGDAAPMPPESVAPKREANEAERTAADRPEGRPGGPGSVAVMRKPPRVVNVKHARAAQPTDAQGADSDRLVREAEQKYLAAIRILSRDVAGRRTRMDPQALARFERTLGVIDKSIAETRAAARRHPRDPLAVQYMLTAYAKKVEVLREMAQD